MQSPAFVVLVLLTTVILVIHFVFVKDIGKYWPHLNTELIGIIITVTFVQFLFEHKKHRQEKSKERAQVLRDDEVIQIYLSRCKKCFNTVLSSKDRSFGDAFESSDLTKEQSAIDAYHESEKSLAHYIQTLLSKNNYNYYHSVHDLFIKFVEIRVALKKAESLYELLKAEQDIVLKYEQEVHKLRK
jgi:L-lactate permease